MLPRKSRIVSGETFRSVMRSGRKAHGRFVVMYQMPTGQPFRAGFIVSKAVGNAVARNRVKRRLREIATLAFETDDIVIRAKPAASQASWQALNEEVANLSRRLEH